MSDKDKNSIIDDVETLDKKDKKSGGKRKLVGVIILIVLIAVCIIAIQVLYKTPADNTEVPAATTEPVETSEVASATASAEATETEDFTGTAANLDEVWPLLEAVYAVTVDYVDSYNTSSPFISHNGYLYDSSAQREVTIDDLIDSGRLDEEYRGEKIYMIYAHPSDFAAYEEVQFSNSNNLQIFIGYPTVTGVALYTEDATGVIYRENLNDLISSYNSDHGDFIRVTSGYEDYQKIVEVLEAYEYSENGIDIRYLAVDDKYAFAASSDKADPTVIRNYVLTRTDGSFTVLKDRLEEESIPICAVNNAAPDMNLDLMPPYNIKRVSLMPTDYFSFIIETLEESDDYSEEYGEIDFISGTNEYVFILYSSGKAFLASSSTGSWGVAPVEDWIEVETLLRLTITTDPPTYILRQQ